MFTVISDTHNHNWSVFSHALESGINSRLQHTLDEIWRAAETAKKLGHKRLIHCGDLFHVRGSIAPSVLNPTIELFEKIRFELDLEVYVLAGNHDLEGNNSTKLGNAGYALISSGVNVVSNPFYFEGFKMLMIPYFHSCNELREMIKLHAPEDRSEVCLFIHAPLNGVIAGIPDHGLSAKELKSLGFKAVFCGHYHHHQVFDGNICSVGSITQQTFGDIGTKAGFITFDGESITHYPTNAPKFVDFSTEWDELEMIEYIKGNFVRARLEDATNEEVEEVKNFLKEAGAAGTQIVHVPKTTTSREGATVEGGKSAKVSLKEWCEARKYDKKVIVGAQEILDEVEAKRL